MSALQVVAGIIEDDHGLVLLAQRPPGKLLAGFWEFPGGKIEAGESSQEALVRELREELSLEVAIGRFMGVYPHTYDWGKIALHVFIARALNSPKRSEHVNVFKWINAAKINPLDLRPQTSFLLNTIWKLQQTDLRTVTSGLKAESILSAFYR
ncbi:MAG: (deoxy)nucleoside triphosphate pyrophosphohydrolase [Bdellovibrionaceae bacterium]|nr:(deoxy)nucleoside triphosphate pyrophosphohydrolase [Pseudobdellovibrionaceae bacterium]